MRSASASCYSVLSNSKKMKPLTQSYSWSSTFSYRCCRSFTKQYQDSHRNYNYNSNQQHRYMPSSFSLSSSPYYHQHSMFSGSPLHNSTRLRSQLFISSSSFPVSKIVAVASVTGTKSLCSNKIKSNQRPRKVLSASVSHSPFSTSSHQSHETSSNATDHEMDDSSENSSPSSVLQWPNRSHYCADVSANDISIQNVDGDGTTNGLVSLCGWVDAARAHGNGVMFVDLRDSSGIVQIVGDPTNNSVDKEGTTADDAVGAAKKMEKLRQEYCVHVRGVVRKRKEANKKLRNGDIEVVAYFVDVLNKVEKPLPFPISSSGSNSSNKEADGSSHKKKKSNVQLIAKEETRLRHRVMDLRSIRMANNLKLRHKVTMLIRRFLENRNFLEVETPLLTASTPEGARDYLVPSRIEKGRFFALPQSPQVFKQLLMCGGVDRYYQIAKCFRDEDLRADRQPEFTQLDMEMAFMDQQSIMALSEELIRTVFEEAGGISLPEDIPVLTYDEAMSRYGSDKPDLRFKMELVDVSSIMLESGFKVFSDIVVDGGIVKCVKVSDTDVPISNSRLKNSGDIAKEAMKGGVRGIAYLRVSEGNGIEGVKPLKEGLSRAQVDELLTVMDAHEGDLLIFAASGNKMIANSSLGRVRNFLALSLGLIDEDAVAPLWVVDWPLFETDEDGSAASLHHPFTAPQMDTIMTDDQLLFSKAMAYDFVYNGIELGGGSLRIHKKELQQRVFNVLGLDPSEANEKFGALLEALSMGAPPHGGIAFGVDRMIVVLAKEQSIRDVIAFPKTTQAQCLLMQAPSEVSIDQLRDLGL